MFLRQLAFELNLLPVKKCVLGVQVLLSKLALLKDTGELYTLNSHKAQIIADSSLDTPFEICFIKANCKTLKNSLAIKLCISLEYSI